MKLIDILRRCRHKLYELKQLKYPNVSSKATIRNRVTVLNRKNLYMQEHASLSSDSLIMNGRARFKMGANSMAAVGLTVVTGDHMSLKGKLFRQVTDEVKDKLDVHHRYDSDVIVEEDVWIGTHVTLLNGCHIGRGAIVGGGSVVRTKIPPYAIVIGNPAKVINFRFNPLQALEHEAALYPENERLDEKTLLRNYQKYFVDRLEEISKFV